jgi:DNA glycosylase AlkZ-like
MAGRDVLGNRALNRALLARQGLLARAARPIGEMVEALVGLQAQEPHDPYVALWSRIDGFDPLALSDALSRRRVVRGPLMRGTIHLATARDALRLRPLVQPVLERAIRSTRWSRDVGGADPSAIAAAGRELLETAPRTRADLGRALSERFDGADPLSLAYVATYRLPVVQLPPRGLWGATGRATWTTIEDWLGRPLAARSSATTLVRRYLAAFGPATPADMRTWSGLAGLTEVFDRLRPTLRRYRGQDGRELFDVPEGPMPDPDTPAPVRFLPEYDNLVLSHADRGRVVPPFRHEPRFWKGGVLVDGSVRASWKTERGGESMTLLIDPVAGPLPRGTRARVIDEGAAFLAFLTDGSDPNDVRILPEP